MNGENKYVAITLGPIASTMDVMTKPISLWAASFLFSDLAKRLCLKLLESGIPAEDFITPYVPEPGTEEFCRLFDRTDGVGLFSDRIIFLDSAGVFEKMKALRENAVRESADAFGVDPGFLSRYVRVSVAEKTLPDTGNPILSLDPVLNSLELFGAFVPRTRGDELSKMLANGTAVDSALNRLGLQKTRWQLLSEGKIRDIGQIALSGGKSGLKKDKYYCILRADGDNMGAILKTLNEKKQIREFSKVCFTYSERAAALVGAYGGVTIYSGGDDLFALVPCEGTVDGRHGSVLTLIERIRAEFRTVFDGYIGSADAEKKPALSFGVMISYVQYPLYEAVRRSAELLFGEAKNTEGKNTVALEVRKHSGQSICILLRGDAAAETDRLLTRTVEETNHGQKDTPDEVLLSALHKISLFRTLFDSVGDGQIPDLFRNTFDSDYHLLNAKGFLHGDLPEFYLKYCRSGAILSRNGEEQIASDALSSVLRYIKFHVEKKDEKEVRNENV